jgi:hypothetical protein
LNLIEGVPVVGLLRRAAVLVRALVLDLRALFERVAEAFGVLLGLLDDVVAQRV